MARTDDTDREWEQRSVPACESCAELRDRLERAEAVRVAAKAVLSELRRVVQWESEATEQLRAALGAAGERIDDGSSYQRKQKTR